ncbi:linear amide C-N hydrolase [Vibrio rotiferianus]|uniref:linear amide C-N hydrolase n=1 Tax=Vibrio rotiferianus TaxID=190895 RepID=UPI00390BD66F
MCTRIFNNLNPSFPMTGRNFDWHNPLTTYLYRLPAGDSIRLGINDRHPEAQKAHHWTARYSSVCTYLGSDNIGLASIDGVNEKGLAVNGLEDLLAYFENATEIIKSKDSVSKLILEMLEQDEKEHTPTQIIPDGVAIISSLRWVQFTLDNFESVREAADYFRNNPDNLYIVSEYVPDGKNETTTKLHLTLSDTSGNSAIIELRGGRFSVNESENYNVATVTPRFEIQQLLLKPWLEKWNHPKNLVGLTLFDVPGGTATHQRFARASYYYKFSQPAEEQTEVLSQTRALMATCATPLGCHFEQKPESPPSATTLWCSIIDHNNLCYHTVNSSTMAHNWVELKHDLREPQRTLVINAQSTNTEYVGANVFGDLSEHMETCPSPFDNY